MSLDESEARLLRAAERLETWAECLPRWGETGRERWYEFLDRRYEEEMKIIEQIQRTPNCHIKTCEVRQGVHLVIAGIAVRTNQGLKSALLKWAKRAREQLG